MNTRWSSRRGGLCCFVGHRLETLREREAGPHRAREQVQDVRKLGLEVPQALLPATVQERDGKHRDQHDQDQRGRGPSQEHAEEQAEKHRGEVDEQRLGWAQREIGLFERVLGAFEESGAIGDAAGDADHPLHHLALGHVLVGLLALERVFDLLGRVGRELTQSLLDRRPRAPLDEDHRDAEPEHPDGRQHGEDEDRGVGCRERHRVAPRRPTVVGWLLANSDGSSEMP